MVGCSKKMHETQLKERLPCLGLTDYRFDSIILSKMKTIREVLRRPSEPAGLIEDCLESTFDVARNDKMSV